MAVDPFPLGFEFEITDASTSLFRLPNAIFSGKAKPCDSRRRRRRDVRARGKAAAHGDGIAIRFCSLRRGAERDGRRRTRRKRSVGSTAVQR